MPPLATCAAGPRYPVDDRAMSSSQYGPSTDVVVGRPNGKPFGAPRVFCVAAEVWVSSATVLSGVLNSFISSWPAVALPVTNPSARNQAFSGIDATDVRI